MSKTDTAALVVRLNHALTEVEGGYAFELMEAPEIGPLLNDSRDAIEELRQWVNDLQSGMYVNCVYCGHRYGPGETTPVSMADALKDHVEQCKAHPMFALRQQVEALTREKEARR